jgi:hypothetical protein
MEAGWRGAIVIQLRFDCFPTVESLPGGGLQLGWVGTVNLE